MPISRFLQCCFIHQMEKKKNSQFIRTLNYTAFPQIGLQFGPTRVLGGQKKGIKKKKEAKSTNYFITSIYYFILFLLFFSSKYVNTYFYDHILGHRYLRFERRIFFFLPRFVTSPFIIISHSFLQSVHTLKIVSTIRTCKTL